MVPQTLKNVINSMDEETSIGSTMKPGRYHVEDGRLFYLVVEKEYDLGPVTDYLPPTAGGRPMFDSDDQKRKVVEAFTVQGMAVTDIAEVTGIPERTVYHWQEQITELIAPEVKELLPNGKKGRGRPRKTEAERMADLEKKEARKVKCRVTRPDGIQLAVLFDRLPETSGTKGSSGRWERVDEHAPVPLPPPDANALKRVLDPRPSESTGMLKVVVRRTEPNTLVPDTILEGIEIIIRNVDTESAARLSAAKTTIVTEGRTP